MIPTGLMQANKPGVYIMNGLLVTYRWDHSIYQAYLPDQFVLCVGSPSARCLSSSHCTASADVAIVMATSMAPYQEPSVTMGSAVFDRILIAWATCDLRVSDARKLLGFSLSKGGRVDG